MSFLDNIPSYLKQEPSEAEILATRMRDEGFTPKPKGVLDKIKEVGEKYDNNGRPVHDKPDGSKWTIAQKMAACPRNGGSSYGILKIVDGGVERLPRFCHRCEECLKAEKEQYIKDRKEEIEYYYNKAKYNLENGHWRVKTVEEGKEDEALKKRISRNQEGRHISHPAIEKDNHNDVWTYVDDNTPNPEVYGEPGDPRKINFERLREQVKATGKKMGKGKAFTKPKPAGSKGESVKVIVPEIIVKGGKEAAEKAETIAFETNYLVEAKNADDVMRLYAYQTKLIIQEMEKEGIEVSAVVNHYRNYEPGKLVKMWNDNVEYQMSIFVALQHEDNAGNLDIVNRLYYPNSQNKELVQ